jgi:CubicO group peptidase (beta-lactamase class C family)
MNSPITRRTDLPIIKTDAQKKTNAELYLDQKLRELISEGGLPALAAAIVRKSGDEIVTGQQGVRKIDESGAINAIQPGDQFNMGSVSKVITGSLIGKLVELGTLGWKTSLEFVYPNIWAAPAKASYKAVTVEQLLTHTSRMPYTPAADNPFMYDWITYTAADMTKPKLRARRVDYVKRAVQDQPITVPWEYSGGGIIAASIAETKTGVMYEDLVRQHVFNPLGMTNSGFGVQSGVWNHEWDGDTFTIKPEMNTRKPGYNWTCRAPVGSFFCSADDFAKYMKEQLRAVPQVTSKPMRTDLQTTSISSVNEYVHGAWAWSNRGDPTEHIWHTGATGGATAAVQVFLHQGAGFAAMSNVHGSVSDPAVGKMMLVLRQMHDNWDDMFARRGRRSNASMPCLRWCARRMAA